MNYIGLRIVEGNTKEAKLCVQIYWEICMKNLGIMIVERAQYKSLIKAFRQNRSIRLDCLIALKTMIMSSKLTIA